VLAIDIMNRSVVSVSADSSLADAAQLMIAHGINSLPVVDELGHLVGMIGIRDILRAPARSGSDTLLVKWDRLEERAQLLRTMAVHSVMARRVVTADETSTVTEVAALMANRGLHPIPIMRGDTLLGVVGRADVVRALLDLAHNCRS